MLEMQFNQRETMIRAMMNEDDFCSQQVITAIRQAIENPRVKTPYEQWLCDMWDNELRIDWPQTSKDNEQLANKIMNGIRQERQHRGWRVNR